MASRPPAPSTPIRTAVPPLPAPVEPESGKHRTIALALWLGWIALTIGWWVTHSGIVRMIEQWTFHTFGASAHWATFVLLQTLPLFVTWTLGRRWTLIAPLSVAASILVSALFGLYLGRRARPKHVEVTHPGKGATQVLRHDFSKATPIEVTVDLAWSQNISAKVVSEELSLTLELTPHRLSRAGALRYDFRVKAIAVPSGSTLGSFLASRFDGASSARGWATVYPDGSLGTVKLLGGHLAENKPLKMNSDGTRTAMLLEADERFQGETSFRLGTLDTYVDVDTDFQEAMLDGFNRRDGDLKVTYMITPRE